MKEFQKPVEYIDVLPKLKAQLKGLERRGKYVGVLPSTIANIEEGGNEKRHLFSITIRVKRGKSCWKMKEYFDILGVDSCHVRNIAGRMIIDKYKEGDIKLVYGNCNTDFDYEEPNHTHRGKSIEWWDKQVKNYQQLVTNCLTGVDPGSDKRTEYWQKEVDFYMAGLRAAKMRDQVRRG